jgi:hypothetical protein
MPKIIKNINDLNKALEPYLEKAMELTKKEIFEVVSRKVTEYYEEPVVFEPEEVVTAMVKPETIIIRDTVYYVKENVTVQTPAPAPAQQPSVPVSAPVVALVPAPAPVVTSESEKKTYETPWMMGVKTNLLGNAIAVPTLGWEVQIGKKLSLDIQGFATRYNVFVPEDINTNVYGFSPELRWWPGGRTMRKGQFIGLHARCAWYTLQWKDGLLYQNGPADIWEGNNLNSGNATPALSAGLTYGYSLGFGRKGNWGLEFLVGFGYASYRQNTAEFKNNIWQFVEHQDKHHFGLTRAGLNLTYRFSVRNVNPSYYDNH